MTEVSPGWWLQIYDGGYESALWDIAEGEDEAVTRLEEIQERIMEMDQNEFWGEVA